MKEMRKAEEKNKEINNEFKLKEGDGEKKFFLNGRVSCRAYIFFVSKVNHRLHPILFKAFSSTVASFFFSFDLG